jgi:hypothetical protein
VIWPETAGWLGLATTVAFVVLLMAITGLARVPRGVKVLLIVAVGLRVVGALIRHQVLFIFYGGSGDAQEYYRRGLQFAESFWQFDFSPLYSSAFWEGSRWWGTNFVAYPSALVLSFIGPTLLGEFVVFALLSFLGLAAFWLAFRNAFPDASDWRYALWIWLYPSLWFWPSSIGKEAIILMGMGLAVAGYTGRRGSVNWILLTVGMFFVLAVRPQVAAVLILSMVVAHSLGGEERRSVGSTVQGLLVLGLGLGGIWLATRNLGFGMFDVNEVAVYLEENTARAAGRSRIDVVGVDWRNVPAALVNMFLRPFPWEVSNAMMAFASLEVLGLWAVILYRSRSLVAALRSWRKHRLLTLGLVFIVVYAIALGMLLANLGIIARQRIFLFPFLFMFLEAVPARRDARSVRPDALAPWPSETVAR